MYPEGEEYEDTLPGSHPRHAGRDPVSDHGISMVRLPDTAAGAVLFSAIISVIAGCIIFLPYLLELAEKL